MRNSKIIISVLATILIFTNGCNKENVMVNEMYSDFISVELSSINNTITDTIYQIKISNSHNTVFEKDCYLRYTLAGESHTATFDAEENLVNKKVPDDQSLGYLNIQNGGVFTLVSNINELNWISSDPNVNYLEKGNYKIHVTLFIEDPSIPDNMISSNIIDFQK